MVQFTQIIQNVDFTHNVIKKQVKKNKKTHTKKPVMTSQERGQGRKEKALYFGAFNSPFFPIFELKSRMRV